MSGEDRLPALPSPALNLSPRSRRCLACIARHIQSYGYPPTLRELARLTGITSTAAITRRLGRLERLGLIRREPGCSRAIEVLPAGRAALGGQP
jgi:repressor LexA